MNQDLYEKTIDKMISDGRLTRACTFTSFGLDPRVDGADLQLAFRIACGDTPKWVIEHFGAFRPKDYIQIDFLGPVAFNLSQWWYPTYKLLYDGVNYTSLLHILGERVLWSFEFYPHDGVNSSFSQKTIQRINIEMCKQAHAVGLNPWQRLKKAVAFYWRR